MTIGRQSETGAEQICPTRHTVCILPCMMESIMQVGGSSDRGRTCSIVFPRQELCGLVKLIHLVRVTVGLKPRKYRLEVDLGSGLRRP